MRMVFAAVFFFALAFCPGCGGTTWIKHGATEQDFNRDKWECSRDAQLAAGGYGPYDTGWARNARFNRNFADCMRGKGWDTLK